MQLRDVCADCRFIEIYADEKSDNRKQTGRFEMFSHEADWQRPAI